MHRFVPDPLAPPSASTLPIEQVLAVKTLVRDMLGLAADTPVTLTEISCADAGCPLVETVLVVFPDGAPPRRWRFTRPRAALTRLHLRQALESSPGTEDLPNPAPLAP